MHAPVKTTDQGFVISSPLLECELSGESFNLHQYAETNNIRSNNNGRAAVAFIHLGSERGVLRHYYRGGMAAKLSDDHFIWSGINSTRAIREYRLLEWMTKLNLPVPVPLGARVIKTGLFYTCDLITREVVGTETLANKLYCCEIDRQHWHAVGTAIRSLHRHGLYHADLNANNILITDNGAVTIIDFDRCSRRTGSRWKADNIKRLKRSLDKLSARGAVNHFNPGSWQALLDSYQQ